MEQIKVKGIVLSNMPFKEKDMLASIFTLEKGIVSAKFIGVKKDKAKLKPAKEIFCFADFVLNAGEIYTVTSAEIIDSFFNMTSDIEKFYSGCAVLNIVKTILNPNDLNPALFVETLKVLKTICYDDVNSVYVINKFLIDIFESSGYKLSLNHCSVCNKEYINKKYLNLDTGEIVCASCRGYNTLEISAVCSSALRLIAITELDKLKSLKLATDSEKDAFNVLKANFKARFGKEIVIFEK